mmetsp:Transcript_3727/g.6363  ORF Transcript_3727/g.6363 Transcript_3727/m.6363 type:complete len:207 (+) Transcript_3727:702-1322(+)
MARSVTSSSARLSVCTASFLLSHSAYFARASSFQISSSMVAPLLRARSRAFWRCCSDSLYCCFSRNDRPSMYSAFGSSGSSASAAWQSAASASHLHSFLLHSARLTRGTGHFGHRSLASVYASIAALNFSFANKTFPSCFACSASFGTTSRCDIGMLLLLPQRIHTPHGGCTPNIYVDAPRSLASTAATPLRQKFSSRSSSRHVSP